MAVVLGDVFPELFAAVGVHSGLPVGAANDCLSALQAMTSGPVATRENAGGSGGGERSAVPTIAFHGDRDMTVHPANGHAILDQACRPGTDLAPSGSLTSERIRTPGGSAVTRVTRTGARGISLAELWIIHGGGHVWSGGGEGESDSARVPMLHAKWRASFSSTRECRRLVRPSAHSVEKLAGGSKGALGLDIELELADRRVAIERIRDVDVHDVADRRAAVAQAQTEADVPEHPAGR